MSDNDERTSIVIEAELGSSLLQLTITNANAAQLFAAAGILEANARVALAGEMSFQEAQRHSPIDIARGMPGARN